MQPSSTHSTIFIVEDDVKLAKTYQDYLVKKGFDVTVIANGLDAVDLILDKIPSMVILDIKLPGIDGIEVCQRIRDEYYNPVLMLAAKADDYSKISALKTGADNFLSKPVTPKLLFAHIEALFRSHCSLPENVTEYCIQDLTLNLKTYTLYKQGQPLLITNGEFELLVILAKNRGQLVPRDAIYQQVHRIEYDASNRSIDVRISTLRKKLNDTTPPYRYIKTVRGRGYMLIT